MFFLAGDDVARDHKRIITSFERLENGAIALTKTGASLSVCSKTTCNNSAIKFRKRRLAVLFAIVIYLVCAAR
jgi:hypothetical protein